MRLMGWSWRELEETPAVVVDDMLADLAAEGRAMDTQRKWAERDARDRRP